MKRMCAWSGQERSGKFYIFQTTEGTELVSKEALLWVFGCEHRDPEPDAKAPADPVPPADPEDFSPDPQERVAPVKPAARGGRRG